MFSNSFKAFIAALLFATPGFAQSNPNLVQQISELSRQIRISAATTEASDKSLVEALTLMEDALVLIESKSSNNGPNSECFNYAYNKYYSSNTSTVATDKAIAACKKIADLNIAQFAYDRYYSSNTSSVAMDKAAQISGVSQKGKLDMIQFAYEKYYSSNTATVSMDRAGNGVANVPRGSLQCLKDFYDRYYGSNTPSVAMDKTLAACSN